MTSDLTPAVELAAKNTIRHPNESDDYRRARQQLLVEEIELRRKQESVASLRRELPAGGEVPREYHFVDENGADVTLADLFGEHDTLVIYSYMFGPQREAPCPMCTSLMGGLDHKIADIRQRVAIAFTARSPIDRLIDAKKSRGWTDLPVYSDESGDYTRDYVSADDADMPAYNVFVRKDGTIRHSWSEEIGGDMADPGQDPRGLEMDPLWLVLDTIPEGRRRSAVQKRRTPRSSPRVSPRRCADAKQPRTHSHARTRRGLLGAWGAPRSTDFVIHGPGRQTTSLYSSARATGRMSRRSLGGMSYIADPARYESMTYRRCGRSGLLLPAISLGLWHNFGDDRPWESQRGICRRAFDVGITHFDLANNYGPPYGAAEANFGRILAADFAGHRDELVISTKAGYDMWPGPYGDLGSRKYLLASLDQSLARLGLDYVDIFYSHRVDPDTPVEETVGALVSAVQQGKALYVGISSYSSDRTRTVAALLAKQHVPLLIHQPSYSMFNRWTESDNLLTALDEVGAGCIAFSPLAQGLLTDRYLDGVPDDSRAATGGALRADSITEERLGKVRALAEIAARRGQTLAQLALVWALRDSRMTSVVIGASSVKQLDDNVAALANLKLTSDELAEIDLYAVEADINLWKNSSDQ